MSCRPACRRPTGRQAHCGACHRTFGGVTGFDDHRRGGQCLDPASIGLEERDAGAGQPGVWRRPMPADVLNGRRLTAEECADA